MGFFDKFKLNHNGMAELLKSEGVRSYLTPHAERVLGEAKGHAPVRTGAYRDSLHIEQDTTDRVAIRVKTDISYGMLVEADTGNLAKSLDAA